MPFVLRLTPEARAVLAALESDAAAVGRLRKVRKALALVESNPRHPGLRTHRFHSRTGPAGEVVWEAYVENQAPRAWRLWFWYGPGTSEITILAIGPHPD